MKLAPATGAASLMEQSPAKGAESSMLADSRQRIRRSPSTRLSARMELPGALLKEAVFSIKARCFYPSLPSLQMTSTQDATFMYPNLPPRWAEGFLVLMVLRLCKTLSSQTTMEAV